ncbi:MAG TPA: hypothetical protein VMI12_08910 [Puia sp.]|nr:hypothetical protein [Puia sp.]
MKSRSAIAGFVKLSFVSALFFVLHACIKSSPREFESKVDFLDSSLAAKASSGTPPFDMDVVLGDDHEAAALIKFRQDPDPAQIVTLDTWVINLKPKHAYLLQRAVNPFPATDCTSTTWLTLGKLLVPQAIHTDFFGNGHEELSRDLSSAAKGTQFRIHFQIIDSVTSATVLTSDCYAFTVR